MDSLQRRVKVLALLESRGMASVDEIGAALHASAATVRRDLAWLEAHSMLRRTYGGAQWLAPDERAHPGTPPRPGAAPSAPAAPQSSAAHAIARAAAALCQEGDSVFLIGGGAIPLMGSYLPEQEMRVFTSSFSLAQRLYPLEKVELTLTGGQLYPRQDMIFSPFEEWLHAGYAQKLFLAADGISPQGLFGHDAMLIETAQRLAGLADEVIVLLDSAHFSVTNGAIMCGLGQVSMVITDYGAPQEAQRTLMDAGVQIMLATPETARP